MSVFTFRSYDFSPSTKTATFTYAYDSYTYKEQVTFQEVKDVYDEAVFERALFLSFVLIGISYYKAFPTKEVSFEQGKLSDWQASFFEKVYQEGLSQYAFENKLSRQDLAHFTPTVRDQEVQPFRYRGSGVLSLQSGGKDSLLVAQMLDYKKTPFTSFYVSSSDSYPRVIDRLGRPVLVARRSIDIPALRRAAEAGGLNGHVPVTYIVQSIGLLQAILCGDSVVLSAIGHEGEEPHAWIADLPVNHQWSKTWQAEKLFAEYIRLIISPDIRVGSPVREYSELTIVEHFVQLAWEKYGEAFSSCNVANYQQGAKNQNLRWCGQCPKCANSYLLFSPFVDSHRLQSLFGGDLYVRDGLTETFKGLLGIDGVMKPFECIGEIDELRYAYHAGQQRGGYASLPFVVPMSTFDPSVRYPAQDFSDLA